MLYFSVLLIIKYPWRVEAFSGNFTNFIKRKLQIIKLNNRSKNLERGNFISQMESTTSKNAYSKM